MAKTILINQIVKCHICCIEFMAIQRVKEAKHIILKCNLCDSESTYTLSSYNIFSGVIS